jgi:hypothetical protein
MAWPRFAACLVAFLALFSHRLVDAQYYQDYIRQGTINQGVQYAYF